MQSKIGYSVIDAGGKEMQFWNGNEPPNVIKLPSGDDVHCPELAGIYGDQRLVERWIDDAPPSEWYRESDREIKFDGVKIMVTVGYAPINLDERKALMSARVNDERNRIIDSGITFEGKQYQTDADSRENIAGAAQLAALAIAAGAKAGDYEWDGSRENFVWIAADNSVVPMDAQTVIAFARAVAEFKKHCIMRGYAVKQNIAAAADHSELDGIDIAAV